MESLRIAVISDIHGNSYALTAVLADIDGRGIKDIVNLGDSFYGPLDPAGTAKLLLKRDVVSVRGNEDRILVARPRAYGHAATLDFTSSRLTADHMDWLKALPRSRTFRDVCLLCHGTPMDDEKYLLREVLVDGVALRTPRAVATDLAGVDEEVILCGHDHVSGEMTLPDGRQVFNPGSVGLPAYSDDHPFAHVMQAGSPHARYGVLEKTGKGWRYEVITVSYDWNAAAKLAGKHGRPDWAEWLATGRA